MTIVTLYPDRLQPVDSTAWFLATSARFVDGLKNWADGILEGAFTTSFREKIPLGEFGCRDLIFSYDLLTYMFACLLVFLSVSLLSILQRHCPRLLAQEKRRRCRHGFFWIHLRGLARVLYPLAPLSLPCPDCTAMMRCYPGRQGMEGNVPWA